VYKLVPITTGKARIQVVPEAGFDAIIYARIGDDCDVAQQIKCGSSGGPNSKEVLDDVPFINGRPVYLIVDGAAGNAGSGRYTLNITVTPGGFCGDGKTETDEACDDANTVPNDGCNPGCTAVDGNPDSAVGCDGGGQPVDLWPGKTVAGKGSTDPPVFAKVANSFANTDGSCSATAAPTPTGIAPDHLYKVTAHATGTLTVAVTNANFNVLLYARKTCAMPLSQAIGMCVNANTGAAPTTETLSFVVTKDVVYYVVVDGVLNGKGDYNISFKVQ
jgi:cysteine-rich repeat protein